MIGYTRLLSRHSRALYLSLCLLAAAGVIAYRNLPSNVIPSLSFPRIAVIVSVGDMGRRTCCVDDTHPGRGLQPGVRGALDSLQDNQGSNRAFG